jgi:hypothetical protein
MTEYIRGSLTTGVRGFFCDKDENFIESIPNSVDSNSIVNYLSKSEHDYASIHSGRVIIGKNKIVGYSGRRKFFYILNATEGLLVFNSIFKNEDRFSKKQIDCYIKASKFLEGLDLFPKIYDECNVSIDIDVVREYSIDASKFRMNKKARALVLQRIYTPSYFLRTDDDNHLSLFRRGWKNKRMRPFHWSDNKLNMMYGEEFCDTHPDFRVDYYKRFCRRMDKICVKNRDIFKTIQKQTKPNTKYGNVIYSLKDKKWYFVDLEANI